MELIALTPVDAVEVLILVDTYVDILLLVLPPAESPALDDRAWEHLAR